MSFDPVHEEAKHDHGLEVDDDRPSRKDICEDNAEIERERKRRMAALTYRKDGYDMLRNPR